MPAMSTRQAGRRRVDRLLTAPACVLGAARASGDRAGAQLAWVKLIPGQNERVHPHMHIYDCGHASVMLLGKVPALCAAVTKPRVPKLQQSAPKFKLFF